MTAYRTVALRTSDKRYAASKVLQFTRADDESWHKLRLGLNASDSRARAEALLWQYDLEPKAMSEQRDKDPNIDAFIEYLQAKVPHEADGDDHEYGDPVTYQQNPEKHLQGYEFRALQILNGRDIVMLSDAKEQYLSTRKADDVKVSNLVDRAFKMVYDLLGDRPLEKYSRKDVSRVIKQALEDGLKTQTIRRRLGVVRAAVNETMKEYELDLLRNPFADFKIPNLGEDAKERTSLTDTQFNKLRQYVACTTTDTANLIGLLLFLPERELQRLQVSGVRM